MLIAPEERKSQGPLIVFIDLLFLLVAFLTLLVFFIQSRQNLSDQSLQTMQQHLERLTGEELEVPQALERLETVVERVMEDQRLQVEQKQRLAERRRRRAERDTFRLEYTIEDGIVVYQERRYTLQRFRDKVVAPLRQDHWISFRAFAAPDTPFGQVIASRRLMLEDSNEFDTYWDNVTRKEIRAEPAPR